MRFAILIIFIGIFVNAKGQTTIIIESLPNTTPEEDTIFIAGNFNNWSVNDVNYMLHQQLDGKYSVKLPVDTGTIEFKFTRGSWLKVETSKTNEYISNRLFNCNKNKVYIAKIENWQDLGGLERFNYMLLLMFAIAFYGVSLLFFALRVHLKNKTFIFSFFVINTTIIVALIGGVLYHLANLIWQSYIGMLGIAFLFIWGPILKHFFDSFKGKNHYTYLYLHFIPSIIVILITILRFTNYEPLRIYAKEFNPKLSYGSMFLISLGLISCLVYILASFDWDKTKSGKDNKSLYLFKFIKLLFSINLVAFALAVLIFVFQIAGVSARVVTTFDLVLILLSAIMFVEFYYYLKYPGLFHKEGIETNNEQSEQKITSASLSDELAFDLKNKVIEQMIEKKAFKDPMLNITTLSEIIDTKPYLLSKVLNEKFHKSFRDFINEYRIKEFIDLVKSGKYKNYTLLALSYEVGFNSKSTFNLAFKKITGVSPRNFLKNKDINLNQQESKMS